MLEVEVPGEVVISVVDDDESVREGVVDLLRTLDFSAHSFASAEEFLGSDQLSSTSCLIADMQLPGMTGLELYDRLVTSGFAIPTLLITAFPDESVQERALQAGVMSYLIKPFPADDFVDFIRLALRRIRPTRTD
jgi:FixJ family two-component response regulator